MLARIVYRLKSYMGRRALEKACPELRKLRIARERAQRRHGRCAHLEAEHQAVINRALGWRGL